MSSMPKGMDFYFSLKRGGGVGVGGGERKIDRGIQVSDGSGSVILKYMSNQSYCMGHEICSLKTCIHFVVFWLRIAFTAHKYLHFCLM